MNILLVEDDHLSRDSLEKFLSTYLGHNVDAAESVDMALELLINEDYQLIVSDLRMPGKSGLDLLAEVRQVEKRPEVIIITGFGELDTAIEAMRLGAIDYLQKPVDVDNLARIVARIENLEIKKESESTEGASSKNELNHMVSSDSEKSTAIRNIFGIGDVGFFSKSIQKLVNTATILGETPDIPILIEGDTGTGKEIFARIIHMAARGVEAPFITVNCSAISPHLFESELFGYESGSFTGARQKGQIGKLELAQGGTIFLDEIGDLPLEMQPKLLRAVQMKELYRVGGSELVELDIRVVCATNRNLEAMVKRGIFREDLLHRLNTGHLKIPNLANRKSEIVPLAEMFLLEFSRMRKRQFRFITPQAGEILEAADWTGNIRELRNVVDRATILHNSNELLPEHLNFITNRAAKPAEIGDRSLVIKLKDKSYPYDELENELFSQMLALFSNNKSKLSDYLSITRNRLNRKLNPD